MKIKLIVFSILTSCLGFSQSLMTIHHDTTIIGQEVLWNGDLDLGSTKLQNTVVNRFLFGGEISPEVIQAATNKLSSMNRTGIVANTEFEYRNYTSSLLNGNWGFLIKAGVHAVGSASYSNDLFGLVMSGNTNYLGQSVNLNASAYQFTVFQKLGFGFIHKKTKTSFTLNYVNLTSNYRGGVNSGSVTFDQQAENVDFLVNANFSSTSKNFVNGVGAALDVDYRIPINWGKSHQAFIQVQAKNLGFATLTNRSTDYRMDSTYHYQGFNFEQLKNLNGTTAEALMDTMGIVKSREKGTIVLPFYVQIGKIVSANYSGKWQSFFGLRIYPIPTYSPYFYLGANYRPVSFVDLGLSASYGGFSGFRAGFYVSANFKKMNLGIGSEDLYGVFSEKGYGKSLNFRLRCTI